VGWLARPAFKQRARLAHPSSSRRTGTAPLQCAVLVLVLAVSQSPAYAGIIGQESRHVTCVKPRARTDRRGAPRSMHVHCGMVSGGPAALRRRGRGRDDMPRCSCAAQAWACRAAANRKKNDGVPVRPRLSVPLVTAACPGAHLFRCRISHWGGGGGTAPARCPRAPEHEQH
jgi:hypothetical protein